MAKTTTGTPFPWLPMLAIAVGLLSHFYALTSLFPYAGYMVQSLGVTTDKDEAGQSLLGYPLCSVSAVYLFIHITSALTKKGTGEGEGRCSAGTSCFGEFQPRQHTRATILSLRAPLTYSFV